MELEILKLVKRKMFEPRKKIIFDLLGNRKLETSLNWASDRQLQTEYIQKEKDLKILEECEGWNVADKDYVDFKISEAIKQNKQEILSIANSIAHPIPSAPSLEPAPSTSLKKSLFSSSSPVCNHNYTFIYSPGIISAENVISFFSPGIVIKKGWTITDFTLFCDSPLEEEIVLVLYGVQDLKSTQLSKIKLQNKQVMSAETKHKFDTNRPIIFNIKLPKMTNPINMSLQIGIEI